MATVYNPKSKIVVVVDDVGTFNAAQRVTLGAFSSNLLSCEWTYLPTDGGLRDASVKINLPVGSVAREAFDGGRFGLISIYRSNHLAELPMSGSNVDIAQNFDNNERSYLLFQGLLENPSSSSVSNTVSFKVKGYSSWLKELEYTGTFTDIAIGTIFSTVMADVTARSYQPIKSYVTEDMTFTGNVPNSFHVLHRTLTGTYEYKSAKLTKILEDLQSAAGGQAAVTFGVRCGSTSDSYGEAYLLEWRGKSWTPDYQEDSNLLDAITPIPYTRATGYNVEVDTSSIVNSVEVYGADNPEGTIPSFYSSQELVMSREKYGRRHKTLVNASLTSDRSCEEYAKNWLVGRANPTVNVSVEWSDEQTLNDSQRVGGSTLAKPHDILHYMRDMNSMLHVTNAETSSLLIDGKYSDDVGIDSRPTAIQLSKVASGNPPVIKIDTTLAPFYGTNWSSADTFGHPNKAVTYAQYSTTRSTLFVVRFGLKLDGSDAGDLNNLVVWEHSRRLRIRLVQSGGAGTNFGATIDTWRGGSVGWVDELATYGHKEVLTHLLPTADGGIAIALQLGGLLSTVPTVSLWASTSGSEAWRTLLATTNAVDVVFASATDFILYTQLAGQSEDYILIGVGTKTDGASLEPATSGNFEIYSARCYEGELNATTGDFEYGRGLDAEGSSTTDKAGSFLYQEAFSHLPRIGYSAGRLMTLEPSFKKTVSGNDYHFVKWTRAQLNASGVEIYDGFSNDGYHARLYSPQTGDGLVVGDGVTTATNWATTEDLRSPSWRLGSTGEYSKKLGVGVSIRPREIRFKYAGEHSPLKISVKGGVSEDSLVKAASEIMKRMDDAERDSNASL